MMRSAFGLRPVIAAALFGVVASTPALAFEPGEVTCIAPSDPGGGWDFTCRALGRALFDLGLVKEPVEVVNMAGERGGEAFTHVVEERADDPNLIVAASSVTTTRLALGDYGGRTAKQVRWPGALGADFGVIAVPADSPLQGLQAFVDGLMTDGLSVAGGGSDDLKLFEIARAGGFPDLDAIDYRRFEGGGPAAEAMLGGETDAFAGDLSEILPHLESGEARALAVLSAGRLPGAFEAIPTAVEQGYPVIVPNWRGIYLPGKISPAAFAFWTDAIATVYASPEWKAVMADHGLMPFPMTGPEMETFVERQILGLRQMVR